jgi:hypothetical protein
MTTIMASANFTDWFCKEFSECCLSFDGTIVTNASFVKNLGIFFDRTLCMQLQSCYFQIRNIERNRSYTSEDACTILVCSLVTSRLDYGNALIVIGAWPWRTMKVHNNNLYWMRYYTGSQWSDMRTGVMWSCFLLRVINLAAIFWTTNLWW